jgi:hypothetical protein
LGNYLFCIAPEATRTTIVKSTMQNVPTLLAISMAMVAPVLYRVHHPME